MSTNYPTTNDPDAIRADIERTREELSRDVNALGESVSPGHIAQRQADKVKGRAAALRERVMGTASDAGDRASGMAHGVGGAASQAGSAVERKTQGNPLAAGVIALGAGWLVGSLLPASQKERELSQAIKDKAEPVIQEAQSVAKDAASESAEHLKQPAQEAAEAVKEKAKSAADDVKQEGQQAASDVRESASESAGTVRNQP
ncbi:DUF3618 domain-containing protein [Terrabacter sp. GCM10028922]|uniref:DUF3618 domain-containing protein n=1 Tax=Terrabacter sp. GCM10028922 TaxID=3273428 RepID=UPI00361EDB56